MSKSTMKSRKAYILKIYYMLFNAAQKAGGHQLARRSFFYRGYQFPMCARCTDVLIGYLLGIPLFYTYFCNYSFYVILCATMFLDWYLQNRRIKESTNLRRLVTGIMGGWGTISLTIICVNFILKSIFEFYNYLLK